MSHGEPTRFAALGLRDEPDDEQLVSLLRPPDWVNPEPAARYDLVVLGGGTAGLVAAAGSAGLGARVALIEAALLGGDCLVTGCIPSKTLLRGAATPNANFEDVMRRVRAVRAEIAPHDSAQRFRDELGVDVFFGRGRFVSRRGLEVDGTPIAFRRALIATGARPTIPAIQGLDTVPFLTSETVFSLETLPARLAILGAGPIGCELAQAFARLGSAVTLIEEGPRILPRDDPDAVQCLAAQFENEGIAMQTQTRLVRVSSASGGIRLELEGRGAPTQLEVERLLVAVGRTPHVEGLGLEAAGVTTAPSASKSTHDSARATAEFSPPAMSASKRNLPMPPISRRARWFETLSFSADAALTRLRFRARPTPTPRLRTWASGLWTRNSQGKKPRPSPGTLPTSTARAPTSCRRSRARATETGRR